MGEKSKRRLTLGFGKNMRVTLRYARDLFLQPNPNEGDDFLTCLNPDSLRVLTACKVEPFVKDAAPGSRYQFERQGYFCIDPDSKDKLVFNRTVSLKDTWAKIEAKQE